MLCGETLKMVDNSKVTAFFGRLWRQTDFKRSPLNLEHSRHGDGRHSSAGTRAQGGPPSEPSNGMSPDREGSWWEPPWIDTDSKKIPIPNIVQFSSDSLTPLPETAAERPRDPH